MYDRSVGICLLIIGLIKHIHLLPSISLFGLPVQEIYTPSLYLLINVLHVQIQLGILIGFVCDTQKKSVIWLLRELLSYICHNLFASLCTGPDLLEIFSTYAETKTNLVVVQLWSPFPEMHCILETDGDGYRHCYPLSSSSYLRKPSDLTYWKNHFCA